MKTGWGIAVLAGVLSLAGCRSDAPVAQQAASKPLAEPKVQRVVFAMEPLASETNSPRMVLGSGQNQVSAMYELPVDIDYATGKYIPMLVESWSLDEKAPGYTMKVRKGVKFHNEWGELTAHDLVASTKDKMKEDSGGTPSLYLRQTVKSQETPDDYTWVVTMTRPDSNFMNYLSRRTYTILGYSAKQYAQVGDPPLTGEPPAGTGPYQFVTRAQSQFIRYKRVPFDHWRGNADFPEIELRYAKEASTRLAGLVTGEVHVTPLPEDLLQEAQRRGFKTVQGRVPAFRIVLNFHCCQYIDPFNISLGVKNPASPLMDVRVRRVLNKAVNRDEMNKKFFGGKGEISINQPFHPTRQGWNPDWAKRFQDEYGYDPAKAKALIAEAGYGPGKPLKINLETTPSRGTPNSEDIIEAIGNYWRLVGIDVNFVTEPNAAKRDTFTDHVVLQDSGSEEWTGSYVAGGSRLSASANMTISAADDILEQIAVTLDDKKRDELYRQMANINFDQVKHVQLLWINPEVAVNGEIVSDYLFPGNITGSWTHIENLKAVR